MVGDDADANAPVNAMEDMGGLPTLPDMYCGLSNDWETDPPDAVERLPVTVVVVAVFTEVDTLLSGCDII